MVAVSVITVTKFTWPEPPEARIWKAEMSYKSRLVHMSCLRLLPVPHPAYGMDVSFEIGGEIEGGAWQPTDIAYFYPRWEMLGFSIFGWLIQLYITCAQENTDCNIPEYLEWLIPLSFRKLLLLRNVSQEAKGPGAVERSTPWYLHLYSGYMPGKSRIEGNETCFLINFHCTIGD